MNLECLYNHQPELWQAPGKTTPVQLDEITGVDTPEYALLQGAVAVPDLSKIKALADDLYRKLLVLASQLGKPRLVPITTRATTAPKAHLLPERRLSNLPIQNQALGCSCYPAPRASLTTRASIPTTWRFKARKLPAIFTRC